MKYAQLNATIDTLVELKSIKGFHPRIVADTGIEITKDTPQATHGDETAGAYGSRVAVLINECPVRGRVDASGAFLATQTSLGEKGSLRQSDHNFRPTAAKAVIAIYAKRYEVATAEKTESKVKTATAKPANAKAKTATAKPANAKAKTGKRLVTKTA